MNSLENLNNWSNDGIVYEGDAPYSIEFSPTTATNQATSIQEDQPFTAPPGTNLTVMNSTPNNIEYTINLSSVPFAATINWGTLPTYVQSEIAGTNIFKVSGIIDVDLWEQIKSPTILINDQSNNFSYTSEITYPDPANVANTATKTWTTAVTVTAVPDISTPTNWSYIKNSIGTIAGTPTILDTNSGTYTLVITPSEPLYVSQLSSTGSGGTSTFDPVLKTLTLTGTRAQVNSHLTAVSFTPATNIGIAFVLSYKLTNPTGKLNIVDQNLTSTSPYTIGIATYVEDTPFSLGYQVLDQSATATSFTISVAQTTPLPSVSAGYFTVNGSNVGNTWSTSNTKANINAANVVYTPPIDYTGTITLNVNQSKIDNGNTVVQVTNDPNNIINAGTNTEIQNMIARSYTANMTNSIFSTTTPAITDGPDIGQSYTITLSSSLGKFGNSVANALAAASYSFTGNKTACNTEFTNMVFAPNYNTSASGTFTYTQTRNGISQVNLSPTLTGIVAPLTVTTYSFTGNSTWTPTFDQLQYGLIQIQAVGGGGGGAGAAGTTPLTTVQGTGGGGGAGGETKFVSYNKVTNPLPNTTYTINIGAGGIGNIANTVGVTFSAGSGGTTSIVSANGTLLSCAGGGGGSVSFSPPSINQGGSVGTKTGGYGAVAPSGGYGNSVLGGGGASVSYNGNNADVIRRPSLGGKGADGISPNRDAPYYWPVLGCGGGGGGGPYVQTTYTQTPSAGGRDPYSMGGVYGGAGNGQPGGAGGHGGGGATWYFKTGGNGNGGKGMVVIKVSK